VIRIDRWTLAGAGVLAALLGAPTPAHARKPGCSNEALATGDWQLRRYCSSEDSGTYFNMRPRWPAESRLRLVDERIDLRCYERPHSTTVDCDWHSVHVYERDDPGTEAPPTQMVLEFPLSPKHPVSVSVNGRTLELDDSGIKIAIADDGRSATVVVEFALSGTWTPLVPKPDRRHLLLGSGSELVIRSRDPDHYTDEYYSNAPGGEIRFAVWSRLPVRITELAQPGRERPRVPKRTRRQGRTTTASFASDAPVQIRLIQKRSVPGGVFVGVGGALLDVDYALRGRIGAEFAAPRRFGGRRRGIDGALFHSLALETDFRRSVTVVPAIELTHEIPVREWWWWPSVGAGTGVPLQFSDEVRPGLRGLATLNWPVIGFVATFDWYPTFAADQTTRMQLGLLGELRF
jgi:hypothetical protein